VKRIYVALLLIIISAAVCIAEYRFVSDNAEKYLKQVELIESEYNNNKSNRALELTKEVSKEWSKVTSPMDTLLLHEGVEKIEMNLSKLAIYIEEDDRTGFYTTCKELKNQLSNLRKSEIPNIENII